MQTYMYIQENKTKFTYMYKVLVVALKNSRLLLTILPDFFQFWKIAGQISRLSKEFKTLYESYM